MVNDLELRLCSICGTDGKANEFLEKIEKVYKDVYFFYFFKEGNTCFYCTSISLISVTVPAHSVSITSQ